MKVGPGRRSSTSAAGSAKGEPRAGQTSGAEFTEAIQAAARREESADLKDLLRRIDEKAELLVERRTDSALSEFRQLVAEFMKRAIKESLRVVEVNSARFLDNSKVFIVARTIEEKMKAMADELVSGKADALSIAAKTSEIRGMLMDLIA